MAEMWSNVLWHTAHGHGQGFHLAMSTVFWAKMEYFEQKLKNLVKKWVKKVNNLMLENICEIFTPFGHEI